MNQLVLTVRLDQADVLRHTPAGVPVLDMVLEHESEVEQAGHPRQLAFSIKAVAVGDIALLLQDVGLGSRLKVTGFLAPYRKGSPRLVLNIQQASRLPCVNH